MLGKASRNVCVMDIAMITTAKVKTETCWERNGDNDKIITLTKLMWIPGVIPVIIPSKHPTKIARNISMNKLHHCFFIIFFNLVPIYYIIKILYKSCSIRIPFKIITMFPQINSEYRDFSLAYWIILITGFYSF